ncbi:MAG TPA: AMP-binding protein [Acidobacteriota bacterium]|nr:AMP-binding protein [Acidobacteriota bacterium]
MSFDQANQVWEGVKLVDRPAPTAWFPNADTRSRSQLAKFIQSCGIDSYHALYERSIADVPWFTGQVLDFLGIRFDPPYQKVLDLSRGIQWPLWCTQGGLNITRCCMDRHARTTLGTSPAVVWEGEEGVSKVWTYCELLESVERCAAGLRAIGLARGDRVGLHLPMMPETVAALLAVARIGAVAVPLFSGYGPAAIESRLRDVGAKGIVTCDAFTRRGVVTAAKEIVDEALERCPSIRSVVVVPRLGVAVPMQRRRDIGWYDLLELGAAAGAEARAAESTGAEDPLIILYSSGTTGQPKGIVHSHCGFPVKAAQDMAFGTDVRPGDRVTWITDLGWMMGPWLIYGATLLGATIAIYDGAPDYPAPDRLWAFCAAHRIGILGVSPTLARIMAAHGVEPRTGHDLSELRILASTGEPWDPETWSWLFEKLGANLPIINYSGGTEISGGILMGNPLLPIKPCSFSGPCPGIAADVVDESGRSIRGQVGELIIRRPWIGMARGFWGDPQRYLNTYWSRWPDVWHHGDWARVDGDGYWHILGRSDDTIKVAGRRVGPAEIEAILLSHHGVAEAAVVGIPDEIKGNSPVAFCVPAPGTATGPAFSDELRRRVADALGKPMRPDKVLFVPALPRTRNSKIMRRVIRGAYLNQDVGNIAALENPESVEAIRLLAPDRAPGKE